MLTAHDLTCQRGNRQLFAGVSFAVGAGEWLYVRGENGAGKTSLLRLIAGLSQPDAGELRWDGQPFRAVGTQYRAQMMFLGHHSGIKDDLTALENLQLACALDGIDLSERDACATLGRLGLRGREDLPVRYFSAGQKRRVLLARLITRNAALWVLDEPFNALDTQAVGILADLVQGHLSQGGMAVITSHQPIPLANGRELTL